MFRIVRKLPAMRPLRGLGLSKDFGVWPWSANAKLLTELLANVTALVDPYLAPPPPARYLADEAAVARSLPPGKAASLYSWDEHRAILDAILFVLEDQLGAASTCSGGAANPHLCPCYHLTVAEDCHVVVELRQPPRRHLGSTAVRSFEPISPVVGKRT